MSDNHFDLGVSRKGRLYADILLLMLKGAGYAAIVFFGIWIGIVVLAWLGSFLPPESKEALDPSPWSFNLEAPMETETVQTV